MLSSELPFFLSFSNLSLSPILFPFSSVAALSTTMLTVAGCCSIFCFYRFHVPVFQHSTMFINLTFSHPLSFLSLDCDHIFPFITSDLLSALPYWPNDWNASVYMNGHRCTKTMMQLQHHFQRHFSHCLFIFFFFFHSLTEVISYVDNLPQVSCLHYGREFSI